MLEPGFFKGKKIFITGHTGFKGTWLCTILAGLGAEVIGYSLQPPTNPNLFELTRTEKNMRSIIGDIRDLKALTDSLSDAGPDIVMHLAAQPIVRDSYRDPVYTYETNVMGTVNILEAIRQCGSVRSFLNVTTDKVYRNNEWEWGYRETDVLNGYDPYSNSKSCSELVTDSYKNSFLEQNGVAVSTARAGNVIGGGDFANDRIIPDCVRAALQGQDIIVRNPYSTRPYQHVLEPLYSYLTIVQEQYKDHKYCGSYNIGPLDSDCVSTGELATFFCEAWGGLQWKNVSEANAVHEANFLKLDCSKIKMTLGIKPQWDVKKAIEKTVEWSKCYRDGGDLKACMTRQINEYLRGIL